MFFCRVGQCVSGVIHHWSCFHRKRKAIKVLSPVHGFRKSLCRFVSTCAKLFPFAAEISLTSGFSTTASEPHMAPFAPNGDHALTWIPFSLQNSLSFTCCHTAFISTWNNIQFHQAMNYLCQLYLCHRTRLFVNLINSRRDGSILEKLRELFATEVAYANRLG